MPRASGVVSELVLVTLSALTPGELVPTIALVRATKRDGGDVRAALRELRGRGVVSTVGEGRSARHSLAPGAPRVPALSPSRPRLESPVVPGSSRSLPASREIKEQSPSGSLNGDSRSEAAAAAAGRDVSPSPRLEPPAGWWESLAQAVARELVSWLGPALSLAFGGDGGRVSPHKPEAGTADTGAGTALHRDVRPKIEATEEQLEVAYQARQVEARVVDKKPIKRPHRVRPDFVRDCLTIPGHLEHYLRMAEDQKDSGYGFPGDARSTREAKEAEMLARLRAEDNVRFRELRAMGGAR